MLKVNNKDTRMITQRHQNGRLSGAFIVNFEHFTSCFSVSIVNFEHVNADWIKYCHFEILVFAL